MSSCNCGYACLIQKLVSSKRNPLGVASVNPNFDCLLQDKSKNIFYYFI